MTRLLIAVFDGLLPHQVNEHLTPTISSLASNGVRFTRHHAVFPTVTRVNSATMVTGCMPGKHGIPANTAVFPDRDPLSVMPVLQPQLDELASVHGAPVLFVPTIGELLADHGMTHVSVVGGTSGNAYVHFPNAVAAGRGGVIHPEFSLPRQFGDADSRILGSWPDSDVPSVGRVRRVAETITRFVLPEIDPDLLFAWFPEPDTSNHAHGLGSTQANSGLSEADSALNRILEAINSRGDEPDVLVLSDHGYSTVAGAVDVQESIRSAGFRVDAGEGSVLTAVNGGAVLMNLPGLSDSEAESFHRWLKQQPWVGSVFSSMDTLIDSGALPSKLAGMSGRRQPDIAISMAWNDSTVDGGYRGTVTAAGTVATGAGSHGSASRHEIRNTLLGSGPSFRRDFDYSLPTGNVDIAPTALALLGIDRPNHMDGRVISGALVAHPEDRGILGEVEHLGTPSSGDQDSLRMRAQTVSIGESEYLEWAGRKTG